MEVLKHLPKQDPASRQGFSEKQRESAGAIKLPHLRAMKAQGSSGSQCLRTPMAAGITTPTISGHCPGCSEGLALCQVLVWATGQQSCPFAVIPVQEAKTNKPMSVKFMMCPARCEVCHLHSLG